MNIMNKNVVVTGAGGFIGSHLTKELVRRGANVVAFGPESAIYTG